MPPPPPPAAEVNVPSPFAERKQRGFFGSFFETWKLVCIEPQKFFGRVRIVQVGTAILFGVLAAWVGGAVAAIFGWLSGMSSMAMLRQFAQNMPSEGAEVLNELSVVMGGGFALGQIVLQPVVTLIAIFITAGLLHLFLLMFRGAGRGFEATLTVVAFSFAVQLLQAVPGCGGLIAAVWQAVILIVGLAAAQRCGVGKAAAAVLLPLVLVCCCVCAVGAMMATWIGAFLQRLGQAGSANV